MKKPKSNLFEICETFSCFHCWKHSTCRDKTDAVELNIPKVLIRRKKRAQHFVKYQLSNLYTQSLKCRQKSNENSCHTFQPSTFRLTSLLIIENNNSAKARLLKISLKRQKEKGPRETRGNLLHKQLLSKLNGEGVYVDWKTTNSGKMVNV